MTTEEIQAIEGKIKRIETALKRPDYTATIKANFEAQLKSLKESLLSAQASTEKKAEATEKKEDAAQEEIKKNISKLKGMLNNPQYTETIKSTVRKKLEKAEEDLMALSGEAAKDKKEAKEVKAEVKEAIKEVEKVTKEVIKEKKTRKVTPGSKKRGRKSKAEVEKLKEAVKESTKAHKKHEIKAEKREKKYHTILNDLMKYIKGDKKLKAAYTGKDAWGVHKKDIDIERDAARHSKPLGYRFKGDNDRRPTAAEVKAGLKDGTVYREIRPNRGDVKFNKKKAPLLERGGKIDSIDEVTGSDDLRNLAKKKMDKGETVIFFGYSDYGGSFGDRVAVEYFKKKHPKNTKVEDTAYNGKNAIVFGSVADDFLKETKDYPLGYENMESFYSDMETECKSKGIDDFIEDFLVDKYTFDREEVYDYITQDVTDDWDILPDGSPDYSPKDAISRLESEGLISEKHAKGGKIKQAAPENKYSYTRKADRMEKAKPVGYRFSEAAVKKGIVTERGKYRKPTEVEIEKYRGKTYRGDRLIYDETRKDKSDMSPRKKI